MARTWRKRGGWVVLGTALVASFELGLKLLAPWRADKNVRVRRTVGVAVHKWAKRSQGRADVLKASPPDDEVVGLRSSG